MALQALFHLEVGDQEQYQQRLRELVAFEKKTRDTALKSTIRRFRLLLPETLSEEVGAGSQVLGFYDQREKVFSMARQLAVAA
jgi:hypothetical protein